MTGEKVEVRLLNSVKVCIELVGESTNTGLSPRGPGFVSHFVSSFLRCDGTLCRHITSSSYITLSRKIMSSCYIVVLHRRVTSSCYITL